MPDGEIWDPFSSVRRGEGWDEESGATWPLTPTLSPLRLAIDLRTIYVLAT
jgi:hypothetical protein